MFLRHKVNDNPPSLPPKILEVFDSELSSLISKDTDLRESNDQYLKQHHDRAPHVQAALQIIVRLLDPASKEKCSQDMIRTLALDHALEDAIRGLEILRGWKAEQRYVDDYVAAAHERYPEATAFIANPRMT